MAKRFPAIQQASTLALSLSKRLIARRFARMYSQPLPPFLRARVALARSVFDDAVADARNAARLLDVDIVHLRGGGLFVADGLGLGVERGQVAQTAGFLDAG